MGAHVVLICGLNIRSHNRIALEEQRAALKAIADEVAVTRIVGDKGSYLIASNHAPSQVVRLVLTALVAHRPGLKIPGAAVMLPATVGAALTQLANSLASKYGGDFNPGEYGIDSDGELWRAGLAVPLFPGEIQARRLLFEKTKNALVLGWTDGCALESLSGKRRTFTGVAP